MLSGIVSQHFAQSHDLSVICASAYYKRSPAIVNYHEISAGFTFTVGRGIVCGTVVCDNYIHSNCSYLPAISDIFSWFVTLPFPEIMFQSRDRCSSVFPFALLR